MHMTNDTMARILFPAIIGAGCMVVALTAMNAIAAMTNLTPNVGDIVAFAVTSNQPTEDATRLIVRRPDRYGCVLDLGVLHRSGGSLIVESQVTEAAGSFRVHWAGGRTSADAANCGDQADLVLDGRELDMLAFSAGGYGAGQKHLPVFINASGV
jgi:hypothetical protein